VSVGVDVRVGVGVGVGVKVRVEVGVDVRVGVVVTVGVLVGVGVRHVAWRSASTTKPMMLDRLFTITSRLFTPFTNPDAMLSGCQVVKQRPEHEDGGGPG
jgi:hypothetical protein